MRIARARAKHNVSRVDVSGVNRGGGNGKLRQCFQVRARNAWAVRCDPHQGCCET